MKFIAPICILFMAFPAFLAGNTLPGCAVASLTAYEGYGASGCTFDGVVFKDFQYAVDAAVLANNITSDNITVSPAIGAFGPDILFSANWGVSGTLLGTGSYVGVLGFRVVTVDDLYNALDGIELLTAGTSGAALANVNTVTEEDCVGGLTGALCSVGGGTAANIGASINGSSLGASAAVSFTPSNSVDVIKTITLTSALGQSDTLSSIGQDLSVASTPEPSTLELLGGGLILLAAARWRRTLRERERRGRMLAMLCSVLNS